MKPSIEVMIHPEMNVDAKRTEKHEESKEEEKRNIRQWPRGSVHFIKCDCFIKRALASERHL